MNTDIVEGALDKTEAGLRATLITQSKLRAAVAAPVVVGETLLYLMEPNGIAARLAALTIGYGLYVLGMYLLARFRSATPARHLLLASAVLDPLALSAWLLVTGEYGALMVGFYLFTILGFGFRTGRPLMYLCQMTAIAGFVLAFVSVPYWQEHVVIWSALLVPLVVVPLYAGALIDKLREAREHAESESAAKSELLAKVSHELRTPLTGIISATELLATESGPDAIAKRTRTILALSHELLQEINDLLDEAKYGNSASELSVAPLDLRKQVTLLSDALESTAASKGVELQIVVDRAIKHQIETDGRLLNRVLLNLASNAVKFTDNGHVRVSIDMLHASAESYRLRFSVVDTGIGIPESFRARIFQPFSQVDQGAARRHGGTGLGLALCNKIVTLMGGELRYESAPGAGSHFWFELTLRRGELPMQSIAEEAAVEAGPVAPRRILVADDNETNLLLLQEMLQKDGHSVETCASGLEALELLAERDFDLLMLDYNLGDMDGVRVLQTYRFGRQNSAPALFLTADTTQLTAARLNAAEVAGVLYKPISLLKLRNAMRDIGSAAPIDASTSASPAPVVEAQAKPTRPMLAAVSVCALDPETIEELKGVSSRPEFFPMLMAEAENDMVRNSQLILDALNQMNHASLRDAAHALTGVSANVGAVRLLALATNLRTSPRDEIDAARERWAADLNDTLRLTVAALRKEVGDAGGGQASGGGATTLHLR